MLFAEISSCRSIKLTLDVKMKPAWWLGRALAGCVVESDDKIRIHGTVAM